MTSQDAAAARAQLQADVPVTERRFELAGVSTNVLEGGNGASVVLLHGPFASATHWLRVLPRLAESHHVIAPDLPGHGASTVDGDPLDAAGTVAWLAELVEQTCPAPPAVVGHAIGGPIAARFAAERPDLLASLVLVDSLGLAPFAPTPEFGTALEEFMAQPSERTHDQLWSYCAFDANRVREQMGADWQAFRTYNVERARTPSVQAAAGALMEHFGIAPIPPAELARIATPTTLIWGREDLAIPLAIAEEAGGRYGWPLRVIEGCADDPPVERPQELVDALRTVLEASAPEPMQAAGGRS